MVTKQVLDAVRHVESGMCRAAGLRRELDMRLAVGHRRIPLDHTEDFAVLNVCRLTCQGLHEDLHDRFSRTVSFRSVRR